MNLTQLKFKLKHLDYFIGYWLNFKGYRGSGLKLEKPDPRNYKHADFFLTGWFGYAPQSTRKILPNISDAWHQGETFCCQWFATAKAKEIYERVGLSVKSLISWGRSKGLTGNLGLSNMQSGEKGLKDYGICEESDVPSDRNYSNLSSANVSANATKASAHKSSSYIQIRTSEVYKMIDEGRPVKIGIPWYSGFNAGSGRENYWLIDGIYGYYSGGHCMYICGYDTDFQGKKGFYIQNSYGSSWGKTFTVDGNSVNGALFITEQMLEKLGSQYGFFANFDMESARDYTPDEILEKLNDMNVKGDGGSGYIYRIIGGGYKGYYANAEAFLKINHFPYTKPGCITIVNQKSLDAIPSIGDGKLTGDMADENWVDAINHMKKPVNDNFKY